MFSVSWLYSAVNDNISSDVNKDLGLKAKATDLSAKAKDLGPKAKAKDPRCQGQMFQRSIYIVF